MKRRWALINESGMMMKDNLGQVRIWESVGLAMAALSSDYHDSPWLRPVELKK